MSNGIFVPTVLSVKSVSGLESALSDKVDKTSYQTDVATNASTISGLAVRVYTNEQDISGLEARSYAYTDASNVFTKLQTFNDNVNILGNLDVSGTVSFREVITTVTDEVILSTQTQITNEGTGTALTVTQQGNGDANSVAVFNAGTEGDSMLINSIGDIIMYKNLDVSGTLTLGDIDINNFVSNTNTSLQNLGASKQNNIGTDDLAITDTSGLEVALQNLDNRTIYLETISNIVTESGLSISDTSGLQIELDHIAQNINELTKNKQDNIVEGSLSISDTSGLLIALNELTNNKQDNIVEGSLSISDTIIDLQNNIKNPYLKASNNTDTLTFTSLVNGNNYVTFPTVEFSQDISFNQQELVTFTQAGIYQVTCFLIASQTDNTMISILHQDNNIFTTGSTYVVHNQNSSETIYGIINASLLINASIDDTLKIILTEGTLLDLSGNTSGFTNYLQIHRVSIL